MDHRGLFLRPSVLNAAGEQELFFWLTPENSLKATCHQSAVPSSPDSQSLSRSYKGAVGFPTLVRRPLPGSHSEAGAFGVVPAPLFFRYASFPNCAQEARLAIP